MKLSKAQREMARIIRESVRVYERIEENGEDTKILWERLNALLDEAERIRPYLGAPMVAAVATEEQP